MSTADTRRQEQLPSPYRAGDGLTKVSVRITPWMYDRIHARSRAFGWSAHEVIRDSLSEGLIAAGEVIDLPPWPFVGEAG